MRVPSVLRNHLSAAAEAGCGISVDNGWHQLPPEILTCSIHTGRGGVPVHKLGSHFWLCLLVREWRDRSEVALWHCSARHSREIVLCDLLLLWAAGMVLIYYFN